MFLVKFITIIDLFIVVFLLFFIFIIYENWKLWKCVMEYPKPGVMLWYVVYREYCWMKFRLYINVILFINYCWNCLKLYFTFLSILFYLTTFFSWFYYYHKCTITSQSRLINTFLLEFFHDTINCTYI